MSFMKAIKHLALAISCLIIQFQDLLGYDLPGVNLGITNILDGGPNQTKPGLYLLEFLYQYHADQFLNECGKPLEGVKSPTINSTVLINELSYQSNHTLFGGRLGGYFAIPIVVSSKVSANKLGFIDAGAGFANPLAGLYIQWDPMRRKDGQRIFQCRIASELFFPIGTNKFPEKTINPASIMTRIDTYWAASLFLNEKLAISSRLYYLWCGKNKKTDIIPGGTFHMNYSIEYNAYDKLHLGLVGYYLQQIKESKRYGLNIPNSKERVVGMGPGFLWYLPRNFDLFGYVYFETKVQNRTKGVKAVLRFIKSF